MARQKVYKLRDVEDKIEELGGLNIKKGGKDYVFDFHGRPVYFMVTHDREVPDHGIQQIVNGILNVYLQENPSLRSDTKRIESLKYDIKNDLKGRESKSSATVNLRDLGSALEILGAEVKYHGNKGIALLGDRQVEFVGDSHGEVRGYEYNKVAEKVAGFFHVDLNEVMEHLPRPKKRSSNLEGLLGKTLIVLVAFAMFAALMWTGATYTGAGTTSVSYNVGYYGIIALLLSFYALVMFFHKLRYD